MTTAIAVAERPLLFSGAMVRAILEGRKSQMRRVLKPPMHYQGSGFQAHDLDEGGHGFFDEDGYTWRCPYGAPGDRLWVRENAYISPDTPGWLALGGNVIDDHGRRRCVDWQATADQSECERDYPRCTPSIHMPRWASRLILEIVSVRVERVQDISEEDAKAEGVTPLDGGPEGEEDRDWSICPRCGGLRVHNALGANYGVIFDADCYDCDTYRKRFRHLWNSINGKWKRAGKDEAGRHRYVCYPWSEADIPPLPEGADPALYQAYPNPWVWCVEFRRVEVGR